MKTIKITINGIFAIMLVLALFGCDNDNGSNEHIHDWAWAETISAACETAGADIETCLYAMKPEERAVK